MPADTAQRTPAGEALRAMLPDGTDPYATITLACHAAFLTHDRDIRPGVLDVVKTDPELAASLIVTLAAFVDLDSKPSDMLAWLTNGGGQQDTARQVAALAEARAEFDETADTLPPVTLESMREMAHAARLAGVMNPCGTPAAYRRHRTREQEPCARCKLAWWIYSTASHEERELLKKPLDTPLTRPINRNWGRVRCGTLAGFDAHREHGERQCPKCAAAATETLKVTGPARARKQCGTRWGYTLHNRNNEHVCDDCRAAQAKYDADRWLKKRASSKPVEEVGADLQEPAA